MDITEMSPGHIDAFQKAISNLEALLPSEPTSVPSPSHRSSTYSRLLKGNKPRTYITYKSPEYTIRGDPGTLFTELKNNMEKKSRPFGFTGTRTNLSRLAKAEDVPVSKSTLTAIDRYAYQYVVQCTSRGHRTSLDIALAYDRLSDADRVLTHAIECMAPNPPGGDVSVVTISRFLVHDYEACKHALCCIIQLYKSYTEEVVLEYAVQKPKPHDPTYFNDNFEARVLRALGFRDDVDHKLIFRAIPRKPWRGIVNPHTYCTTIAAVQMVYSLYR